MKSFLQRHATALFAIFAFSLCAVFGADFVQRNFTSIIMFPGTRAESDTNGFIRAYVNSSNYIMLSTNGAPIFYLSTGQWTGFSGVTTPAAGVTQFWARGVMVGTNLAGVAPSN